MARQKRQSIGRATAAVELMASVQDVLAPPIELTPEERYYFDLTVKSMEPQAWSPHRLLIAARLAQQQVQLDLVTASLAQPGGMVSKTDRGTPIPSPFITTQNTLTNSLSSLTKTLGLSANAQSVGGAHQEGRNAAALAASRALDKASRDPLLAGSDLI